MSESLPFSYDALPYPSQFFGMTHPDRMATMARLHGLSPPPIEHCRVLELGCGTGVNLLAIAQSLPGARLTGVDLSPRQIADGRAWIERLGFPNVALHALDLGAVDESLGPFDYIICHGVYSWVPAPVRDRILAICARNLVPNGIAYVSYNTYPGWHLRGMVRELLLFHVREIVDPRLRVREAQTFLEFLAGAAASYDKAYAQILAHESELLAGEDDSYFLHEHLDEVNHPVYFHEFVAHAATAGLQYVAPAQYSARDANLPTEVQQSLDRLGTDRIRREQYLDFVRNRTFRQSLLCHARHPVRADPSAEVVAGLRMVALASPVSAAPDLHSGAREDFDSHFGGRLSTNQPVIKAALTLLAECWPRSLTLDALRDEIRARLSRPEADPELAPGALAQTILRCQRSMMLQLHIHEPPIALQPGERPRAAPLARFQAEGESLVISLRNRNVELKPFDSLVLPLLDGTRTRLAVVERLAQQAAEGDFELHDHAGQRLQDSLQVRAALSEALEPSLDRLAKNAILIE